MNLICDLCHEKFTRKDNLNRHKKLYCPDNRPIPTVQVTSTKTSTVQVASTKTSNVKLKLKKNLNQLVSEPMDLVIQPVNHVQQPISETRQTVITQPLNELTELTNIENLSDRDLLIQVLKQNQQLAEKIKNLEEKGSTIVNNTVKTVNTVNNTINIYLNKETNFYQILEELGKSSEQIAQITMGILKHPNKFSLFFQPQIKEFIQTNSLMYGEGTKKLYILAESGYIENDQKDAELLNYNLTENLIGNIQKKVWGPNSFHMINSIDERTKELDEKISSLENKERKLQNEEKRKINTELALQMKNGISYTQDTEDEYKRRYPNGKYQLRIKELWNNRESLMRDYLNTMYENRGDHLFDLRKKKYQRLVIKDFTELVKDYHKDKNWGNRLPQLRSKGQIKHFA
jgi:hypothetical protein